jgi:hypothetical protein
MERGYDMPYSRSLLPGSFDDDGVRHSRRGVGTIAWRSFAAGAAVASALALVGVAAMASTGTGAGTKASVNTVELPAAAAKPAIASTVTNARANYLATKAATTTTTSAPKATATVAVGSTGGVDLIKTQQFDDDGRYILRNFDRVKPMSSFLPGVGGLWGVPMWAFYVNRGQGMATFWRGE